jgi:uncharacterized protein
MNNKSFTLNYISALSVLVLFILFNGLILLPSYFFPALFNQKNIFDYLLLTQIIPYVLTFVAMWFFYGTKKEQFKISTTYTSASIFFVSIALFFFTVLLNEYLVGFVPTKGAYFEETYKDFSSIFDKLKAFPVTLVFATCFFAPLLEEILFRGILLRGLLNQGKNPWMAILFTSFLFGLVHANPWQFVSGLFLGLTMGYIYYRTHSLLTTIFIHALNNGIAAYILIMLDKFEVQEIDGISFFGALSIFLFILALGSLLHLLTQKKKMNLIA